MLISLNNPTWFYTGIPRTGSQAIYLAAQQRNKRVITPFARHWPNPPPDWFMETNPKSIISIRNPYTRAVSCWMWFRTREPRRSFKEQLEAAQAGFLPWLKNAYGHYKKTKVAWPSVYTKVACHPQNFWLKRRKYDYVIKQESLQQDWNAALADMGLPDQKLKIVIVKPSAQALPKLCTKDWQYFYRIPGTKELVEELWAEDFEALAPYYGEFEAP